MVPAWRRLCAGILFAIFIAILAILRTQPTWKKMAVAIQDGGRAVGLPRKTSTPVCTNIPASTIHKQYTLNVNKALAKKLEATNRTNVEYKRTDGGLTAKADAISFELMKDAILQFYTRLPADLAEVKVTDSLDNKGNRVQITIKVCYKNVSDSYTVNVYLTKCSFLVNGKSTERFLETDLGKIHEIIQRVTFRGKALNVSELNAMLARQLTSVLIPCKSSSVNSKQVHKQLTDSDSIKCTICGKNCRSRSAFCESSSHWIHYHCDKLSKEDIYLIEKDSNFKYVCKGCSVGHSDNQLVGLTNTGRDIHSMGQNSVLNRGTNLSIPNAEATVPKSLATDILEEETSITQ